MFNKTITLKNLDHTKELATSFGTHLHASDICYFVGDLGAGKSTFARYLIQDLCQKEINVPSPTFSIFNTYDECSPKILHADLYRVEDIDEIDELGFEDYLNDHAFLIEWPELCPYPATYILEFSVDKDGVRSVKITSTRASA